ncbi:MAG: EAL domain-containing protein [Pseudomonadales bacterium]|nr:EAL domain-containing protein [Pseudomonadales bacterium]
MKKNPWKIARLETRIFIIFSCLSSLPLLGLATFAYVELRAQALERTEKELRIASKNYALQIFSRLETIRDRLHAMNDLPESEQTKMIKNFSAITTHSQIQNAKIPTGNKAILSLRGKSLWLGTQLNKTWQWFQIDTHLLLYDIADAPFLQTRCVHLDSTPSICSSQSIESEEVLYSEWPLFLDSGFESQFKLSVSSSMQREDALSTVNLATKIFPAAVLLASILVALMAMKLFKTRMEPLTRLENAATKIAQGKYLQHLNIHSNDEFESVAHAFNKMSFQLERSFFLMQALAKIDSLILTTSNISEVIQPILEISKQHFLIDTAFLYMEKQSSLNVSVYQIDEQGQLNTTRIRELSLNSDNKNFEEIISLHTGRTFNYFETINSDDHIAGLFCMQNALQNLQGGIESGMRQLLDRLTVAVTHFKKSESLYLQAHFDSLTGLNNRQSFEDKLSGVLSQSKRDLTNSAILFLDIDRFKLVNDTEGHKAGDRLLVLLAGRLRRAIREPDIIARMGGDEFAVVIRRYDSLRELANICSRLIESTKDPVIVGEIEYRMGISIGIATYPQDGNNVEELLVCADSAMYQAKNNKSKSFSFFDSAHNKETQHRTRLEMRFRKAIEENSLDIHFQPKLDLTTHRIHSAEALMRWNDAELGQVSPAEFIPVAEDTGTIHQLDPIILSKTLALLNAAKSHYDTDLRIAINASPYQLTEGYADRLLAMIYGIGAKPHCIDVEVTESVFINDLEDTLAELSKLRAAGVQIALDDFGTGYSSLNLLRRLPLDFLKIDRSLITELTTSQTSRDLVFHVIEIAKALKLRVIAEGTESDSEIQILRDFGCDYVQGYAIAKPMPMDEFLAFLSTRNSQPQAYHSHTNKSA